VAGSGKIPVIAILCVRVAARRCEERRRVEGRPLSDRRDGYEVMEVAPRRREERRTGGWGPEKDKRGDNDGRSRVSR
jgi:hypothetical protein